QNGGYVTDVAYVAEFYGDHAPAHINMTAAAAGHRPRPLDGDFTWCDYGCGNGITANILAGCFPKAHFYGVDFLRQHITTAETLAVRGGLDNATFLCKGFADLTADDIPPLDFAVMHGVLSWIDEPTRNAVLDDAAKRLKPGGMLLTGCNAMPGWSAKIPLRNMIYSLTQDNVSSLERARVGLTWAKKMKDAQVKYFRDNPALAEAIDQLDKLDPRYMAHEYFNQHLRAFYFAELRSLMEPRGLKFAGSATVFLNMVDLAVPQALYDDFRNITSRAELEAKRDFIRNETFRRDVWVKGDQIKSEDEWMEINLPQIFGTLKPLDLIDKAVAFGDVQLSYEGEPFEELMTAVSSRGISVANMDQVPGIDALSPMTRVDAARLMIAGGDIVSFARETQPAKAGNTYSIPVINRGMIKELALKLPKIPLAAVHAGTGIEMPNIDAILLLALVDKGKAGAVAQAHKVLTAEAGDVVIGGKTLSKPEIEAFLSQRLKTLESVWLNKLIEIGVINVES
ncbi:MAG: class I SAM-dependent methyltransferase, partial [Rhodospirillaceae bacterium]|nr:class I SAM-dependent methyltransferase [Rhodospirillaceae bacterium]